MRDEDAAPRIKELRAEQSRLQKTRDDVLVELEDAEPKELNTDEVLNYVKDLKALLSKGTFLDQKAFLRSFIKKIDFEPGQVTMHYSIPTPEKKRPRRIWKFHLLKTVVGSQGFEPMTP